MSDQKKTFVESGYCLTRANCHLCQSTGTKGVAMRRQWERAYEMPEPVEVLVNGEKIGEVPKCPYGKEPDCPAPDSESIQNEYESRRQEHEAKQRKALPGAWERLCKGAVGLTKVALGLDRSDDALMAKRRKVCESCEHLKGGSCELCGCWYSQKVKLASEEKEKGTQLYICRLLWSAPGSDRV